MNFSCLNLHGDGPKSGQKMPPIDAPLCGYREKLGFGVQNRLQSGVWLPIPKGALRPHLERFSLERIGQPLERDRNRHEFTSGNWAHFRFSLGDLGASALHHSGEGIQIKQQLIKQSRVVGVFLFIFHHGLVCA